MSVMPEEIRTDVLIVGSGAAGLCAAIAARQGNVDTLVASASSPGAGNATAVSGGIMNAAVGPDDSPEIHFEDTLRSGAFLNDRPLIAKTIEMIPQWLPTLEEYGVAFAKEEGRYLVARSPGHTRARTTLFRPRVGVTLSKPLAETARRLGAKMLPNFNLIKILVRDNRAVGAIGYVWDADKIVHLAAKVIVLAMGGASLIYSRTRIPPGVPGDGHGVALDAGLALQDMEFVQFYPTILAEPGKAKVLISYDHFLGAGAVFRNSLGEDIVAKHNLPEPEMITRDHLSIAFAKEVYEGRGIEGTVLMDATRCRAAMGSNLYNESAFFKMTQVLLAQGEDILARPLRIAPANHYYMGGVQASASGETAIEGLLACGEIVGGTHGANRLQGNSLAETVVMGFEAGRTAATIAPRLALSKASERAVAESVERIATSLQRKTGTPIREMLKTLQSAMTEKAAIVRDGQGLREAKDAIDSLRGEVPQAVAAAPKERATLCTISQLLDTAECIVLSALARRESRGAHYRVDYPETDNSEWRKHVTCARQGEQIVTSTCPVSGL